MSKSLGNVLDPFEVMDKYGTDALRYYCFREVSFGQDGAVSTAGFENRYETRAGQRLRQPRLAHDGDDHPLPRRGGPGRGRRTRSLAADFERLAAEVAELLDHAEITQALDRIWQRVRRLNRYVEEQAPWKLAKDPEQSDGLDTVLRSLADGLRVVTVLLHAYMPETTERLMHALGQEGETCSRSRRRATGAPPRSAPWSRRSSRRCSRSSRRDAGAGAVIDSHTHLDRGTAPRPSWSPPPAPAGVRRILTVGTDRAPGQARWRPPTRTRRSSPPSAGTPTTPRATTTP